MVKNKFTQFSFLAFLSVIALIHLYITRMTSNPHYGKVFYKLGMECQNKCNLNKQLSYYLKAVFYDPNLVDAYYQLAVIYGKKGEHKKGIDFYKKVTQLDHTNADAFFNVGLYYFQKGELDYALRYFQQSDRYEPSQYDTFYYMAKAYDKKGMYEEALYHYVTLIVWGSPRSAEICERIWSISKIPTQQDMVSRQVRMIWNAGQHDLWKQIDQYIRTDQRPEFMQKSREF